MTIYNMTEFRILDRYLLTEDFSTEDLVYHVVLESSVSLDYQVGGVLGILPKNDPEIVSRVLELFSLKEDVVIHDKRKNELVTAKDFLTNRANLTKLIHPLKQYFLGAEDSFFYSKNLLSIVRLLPEDFDFHNDFSDLFLPILPRFYSISSSPRVTGQFVELTVRLVSVKNEQGRFVRYGLCSDYLCNRASSEITAFIKSSPHFTLSEQNFGRPIIMIGSGTGIAPYRAFMQDRIASGDPGVNILIFGERSSLSDFYYRDFWQDCVSKDKLLLFLAFSRDQEPKTYVQQRIIEQRDLISDCLLRHEGSVFVCGSKLMGAEVRKALEEVLEEDDLDSGKENLVALRRMHRYSTDLY